jgi:hypothetical protein
VTRPSRGETPCLDIFETNSAAVNRIHRTIMHIHCRVSPREGLVTTDAKHDDQLSKVKLLSPVNFLLRKSIRESDEYRLL